MYPTGELNELAASKLALQHRIALRRAVCCAEAARVAQPLHWVDRAYAQWRQIAPLVKLFAAPVTLALARPGKRRGGLLKSALRWAPLVFRVVRSVRTARAA